MMLSEEGQPQRPFVSQIHKANSREGGGLLTINWLESCRSDGTVAGHRKAGGKVGPNAFAAGLSAQHGDTVSPC